MLNQLAVLPIEIDATGIVPSNCGFTESDVISTQNRKSTGTGGLVKCLKLKLEAKVKLTVNLDVLKHLEIIENKVSLI